MTILQRPKENRTGTKAIWNLASLAASGSGPAVEDMGGSYPMIRYSAICALTLAVLAGTSATAQTRVQAGILQCRGAPYRELHRWFSASTGLRVPVGSRSAVPLLRCRASRRTRHRLHGAIGASVGGIRADPLDRPRRSLRQLRWGHGWRRCRRRRQCQCSGRRLEQFIRFAAA